MKLQKAPNSKHQILNKHQYPKEENPKRFGHLNLGFVSDLGFRISNFQRGFTLMELLIVIAIIGILISISTVAYTSAQKKSRDSRRRSDLKALSSGFEQYYADNSSNYPATCSLSTTYMPNGMPADPKTGTAYTSTSDWYSCSTSSFCVCAALESETNSTNDCSGDQVSLPAGYLGFYCVSSVQ